MNSSTKGPFSTDLLGAGSTWTSSTISPSTYARLTGTAAADVSGTLFIDQGFDGTNWDYTSSSAVTGGTGLAFSVEVFAPRARIRFTNGATPQAYFRLYSAMRGI